MAEKNEFSKYGFGFKKDLKRKSEANTLHFLPELNSDDLKRLFGALFQKKIWSYGNSCDVIFFMISENLKAIALDLSTSFPRSPRAVFAGYVIAGRMLDKCRAVINGSNHDYHFDCFLDNQFLGFAEIDADEIKGFISTGATDGEVAEWIRSKARPRSKFEIIQWNNRMRELKMSELPEVNQVFLESYVPKNLPDHRPVYVWFDVYDLEENRLS